MVGAFKWIIQIRHGLIRQRSLKVDTADSALENCPHMDDQPLQCGQYKQKPTTYLQALQATGLPLASTQPAPVCYDVSSKPKAILRPCFHVFSEVTGIVAHPE